MTYYRAALLCAAIFWLAPHSESHASLMDWPTTGVAALQEAPQRAKPHRGHKRATIRKKRTSAPRAAVAPRPAKVAVAIPLPSPRPAACKTGGDYGPVLPTDSPEPPFTLNADTVWQLDQATRYLVQTAIVGDTMRRQGAETAIGRLHPVFRIRLARAIRDARAAGIPAAVFSAYRPPAFGIGGFGDKAMSMHAYGLAVDMAGIGRPGSVTAKRWFLIAGRNQIYNPYGPFHRAEHNHFQPTFARAVARRMELRTTITAKAPKNLDRMWHVGGKLISYKVVTALPAKDVSARRKSKRHVRRARYALHSRQRPISAHYRKAIASASAH